MHEHMVETREQWRSARKELLTGEKEHMRRYAHGVEQLMGTFGYRDVLPLGRNEDPEDPGAWWHRHDEYETQAQEARQ